MTGDASTGGRLLGTLETADGKGVVRVADRFDADIETVWSALTDPSRLASWWGEVEGDLRLGGEYRARVFASGWEGTGRVEACEAPQRLLVLTREPGQPEDQSIEVTLTADGGQTTVVWPERPHLAGYGAGIQVHVEDLGAYLAGRERCDAGARMGELFPAYEPLAAKVSWGSRRLAPAGAVWGRTRWVAPRALNPSRGPDAGVRGIRQRRIAMTTPQDPPDYVHRAAVDPEGNRIGKISKVYLDRQTGQPTWVLVETGLFGTRQSLAPIQRSRLDGELVVLAASKDQVKDAPNIEPDGDISDSEQDALRQYYSGHLDTADETGG